jgi:hypothetical protein
MISALASDELKLLQSVAKESADVSLAIHDGNRRSDPPATERGTDGEWV